MRKLLPSLLVLLLLSLMLVAAAASAHARGLPAATAAVAEDEDFFGEADDEAAAEGGDEFEFDDEGEDCAGEESDSCGEETAEDAEECVLQDATAAFVVVPGADRVRLTVHYDSLQPTTVLVAGSLRGGKGHLSLGSSRARFRRSGVYRDSFSFSPKQMVKALAARELDVDLHAAAAPADCGLHLATRAPRRAR